MIWSWVRICYARAMHTQPVLIKRYAGRRLYNTASASYVTVEDLAEMAFNRIRFTVREAETGKDITRKVLEELN